MAQQRQQRRRGSSGAGAGVGVLRLVAVLLLLSLCLARADAVAAASASASLAGAAPVSESEHGVATSLESALAKEEVARGLSTPSTAAAEEDEGDEDVVPERVAMESPEDYEFPSANRRHIPSHP